VIVADDAACDLLGAMHAGLAAGLGVSAALARAGAETGIVAPFQVYGSDSDDFVSGRGERALSQ
jgi:hypothetical protein